MNEHTEYKHKRTGIVAQIISDQRRNSKRRGHIPPNYTIEELREWVLERDTLFIELFTEWVDSGFDRWKRPSFDRIDNDKPYTLDNIQLMTAYDNLKKEGNNPKPIRRSDGREYPTIISAEKEHGYPIGKSKISLVCRGKRKSYMGYTWEFINKGDIPYDLETDA